MNKTILYYTCNTHKYDIEQACRRQLLKAGLPIISVSLGRSIHFGDTQIVMSGSRSAEMMHVQILRGLLEVQYGSVFLCESDVLYHPSHFDFSPSNQNVFYFNTNVYKVWDDGLAVWTNDLQQISGICADHVLLTDFFSMRLEQIKSGGFNGHYEPHNRYKCLTQNWMSPFPNLDIRHDKTLTRSHRSVNSFRNKQYTNGFEVVESVPFWGYTKDGYAKILESV